MNEVDGINSHDVVVFFVAGLIAIALLFAFILYFIISYRNKQKDYSLLQAQKEKIDDQKLLIEKALEDLKLTQAQLIQSEKLASLGELTAGIAHEIQNPLNFVNNFSDVTLELIKEIEEERNKNPEERDAKLVSDNLIDIALNLEKISHHGKRANAIVMGMLQHSRSNTGKKEKTNLNALAEEFLRLSYHGLRAKDKTFNAILKTDFDPSIGKINIIPQEFGRVILNLLTNAFYAVNEKKQKLLINSNGTLISGEKYEPTVSLTTKKIGHHIKICISDNGNGIPKSAIDKIFQPFFTTKPSGQGTGLGLSLSYDIIKNGHGGEIEVQTNENEGATFTIILTNC